MQLFRSKITTIILILIAAYTVLIMTRGSAWQDRWPIYLLISGIFILTLAINYVRRLRSESAFFKTWLGASSNSNLGRWLGILFSEYHSPKSARTLREMAFSILMPVIVSSIFFAAILVLSMFLPLSERGREAISSSAMSVCVAAVFFYPVLHGIAFRLRAKYDFKNVLLTIVLYLPISIITFTAGILIHGFITSDDRSFPSYPGLAVLFASYFGIISCVIGVLIFKIGKPAEPPPAFTALPLYKSTEVTISIASAAAIALLLLLGT